MAWCSNIFSVQRVWVTFLEYSHHVIINLQMNVMYKFKGT